MNILVLNQDWLVDEFRKAGHNAWSCGLTEQLDIYLTIPLLHIDTVLSLIPGQVRPDVIIILDNSSPITIAGLEETHIPIIFYSVDTHHHANLHKYLYNVFDYTLVAQKDYIPEFELIGNRPEWMPLWTSRYMEASQEKQHGAVFVGNLNPDLNPERVKFFDELKKKIDILCMIGEFWKIFPFSEIVINQTVKGDLNFRVFEAMMSGAMLLTEHSGNGLTDLFVPGQHLVTYQKGNIDEVAEKIRYYQNNKEECCRIGLAGREEILRAHTPAVRAQRFLEIAANLQKKQAVNKFFSAAANYAALAKRAIEIDTALTAKSSIAAMKCIDQALTAGEQIDTQLACYIVMACLTYDRYIKANAGDLMLERLKEAYPQQSLFKIAKLRNYLNFGKREEALDLAKQLTNCDATEVYAKAEQVISIILSGGMV